MQSDSMSNGQDISLQGAYRQDQDAKLEVKPTFLEETTIAKFFLAVPFGMLIGIGGLILSGKGKRKPRDDKDSKK